MNTSNRAADLLRNFVAPQGLGISRPRHVQVTAAGAALNALAILLFLAAVGVFIGMVHVSQQQTDDREALMIHGVVTTGEVTRLWSSGDNRRRVNYRFVVDGRTYDDRTNVSMERRRTLSVGSPLAVRFLPSDPGVNVLDGSWPTVMPSVLPFVIPPLIALVGLVCLLAIRGQRRLLAEGRVAPAIVTGHHSHKNSHGGKHRSMTYEFPLLSGAMATGKSGTSAKPPAIGSVITVIYDPESPARNMVFPPSLVKPAR